VVPHDYPFQKEQYDGLFLSNGPGDPQLCKVVIENIKNVLEDKKNVKPIFGICLGHQLLAVAAGFSTHKMKYDLS
jgi:carbamoyl-phosphate synthase/aspartate carbamoyltransferase/dihydroorotase